MFKHILIPTDGSDLSRKALLYGVELARESGAKVTALTVRPPYMVGSMDLIGVVGGQDVFEAETQRYADHALTQAKDGCGRGERKDRDRAGGRRSALSRDHRMRDLKQMRPHHNGLAWPARRLGAAFGQRDRRRC